MEVFMSPFVIYTASDRKYGDFLVEHWYRSLRETTDLTSIEVRILDYGLSTAQRYYLEHEGAVVVLCVRDGHPAVIRFRDMAADLAVHPADQVLACDGGDIVFQADLSGLFHHHQDQFRAVSEDLHSGYDAFLNDEFFTKEDQKRLQAVLPGHRQINAGFLLGPGDRFADLCRQVDRTILCHEKFGPDQLVVNERLHTEGYVELDAGYNFVVATAKRPFRIVEGTFVFADTAAPIPVVHNAGNWSLLRPVRNFGYGPGRNELKEDVLHTLKLVHQSTSFLVGTRDTWNRLRAQAWRRALRGVRRWRKVTAE
jgi:hypothetical protein